LLHRATSDRKHTSRSRHLFISSPVKSKFELIIAVQPVKLCFFPTEVD